MKSTMHSIVKKLVPISLAALMCLPFSAPALAATEKAPATVTVNATASVYVSPDFATVSFGVETRDKSATKAQTDNSAAMKKVIAAVKKNNIADKDIETSNMNMYPTYDYSTNEPKITGYSVSNNITVTVMDLSKISAVVNSAMDAGANSLNGVNFMIKDDESAYQQALKLATQKGMKRAKVLADAAGIQLDGIASISDNGSSGYYPVMRGANANMTEDSAAGAKLGDTIQPGKLEITAQVTITYFAK